MTTIIFVHGISVRDDREKKKFWDEFEQIKKKFEKEIKDELENKELKEEVKKKLENIEIECCFWGNALGAKLNANGASIPLYDSTRSSNQSSQVDENIVRWMQLYRDPLYELRLLSLKKTEKNSISQASQSQNKKKELKNKVEHFSPSEDLKAKFQESGITEEFNQALEDVTNSNAYKEALATISATVTEHRDAIARAIIAKAMVICERQDKSAPILTDATLRDEVVKSLSNEITYSEAGIQDWLKEQILKFATSILKDRRGSISDITYRAVGDILRYQGCGGQEIRDLIKSCVKDAKPPVVLLAHSLGGVACVDLLIDEEQLEQVQLLITVGSQAPYFYEMNVLQSLEYSKPLPKHFPSWLNIYDEKDFLSYIGAGVFKNKVEDICVDNQQPFPRSHKAYWTNSATWKAIFEKIKELKHYE